MSIDIAALNEEQAQAVRTTEGPLLVLAGAGSGKTRVLTYRIAHLLESDLAAPWGILAITFTNKAAAEMRERLSTLVGPRARGMWVSTFHSMCVRMLRADAERLGFSRSFTIYDSDDQKRLVKTLLEEMDVNTKIYAPNTILSRISAAKNELIVPGAFAEQATDPVGKVAARVYAKYQERLKNANAMDFDDLLLYAYLLLAHHDEVLKAYQERFRYILVDEYQDTNHAQYEITKLLAAGHRNIMVVGDDDQSIYSWRGADIRNILEFEQDYPNAQVIKLEQNYRSAGNILEAANAVIAHNAKRKQKRLFTRDEPGERIGVYVAADERDEGRWIASEMERLKDAGIGYDSIAVFYRTNAQSRVLEDMLLRAGIPYRIVGGTRFFDRAEIRNCMAYLSLVVNPSDDMSFERIINVPRRGIGKTTIERIREIAATRQMPFSEAAEMLLVEDDVRASTKQAIASFLELLREARTFEGDLRKVVERIIESTGMIAAYEADKTQESESRIENIHEFFGVVTEFKETHDDDEAPFAAPTAEAASAPEGVQGAARTSEEGEVLEGGGEDAPPRVLRGDSLEDFLEWVRLRTDLDSMTDDGRAVTMMTVHAAKGLEFDGVFVAGMEESIFPHMNSISDAALVEEERRLAYVAITRARKRLYLTCAQARQLYGQTNANPISRFVTEIPQELRNTLGLGSAGFRGSGWEKRGSRRGISGSGREAGEGRVFGRSSAQGGERRSQRSNPDAGKRAGARTTFAAGDTIDHKTFGKGTVTKVDGDTLHVRFAKTGQVKRLLKDYAPIVKIS